MKHALRLGMALSACVSTLMWGAVVEARPRCSRTLQPAWQAIFNGSDLSDWVVEGQATFKEGGEEKPNWFVEDGKIVCAGKGFGFLRFDRTFCDFTLHLEFRMSPNCNSGIGIRADKYDPKKPDTRPSISGFEVQILDDAGKKPDVHSNMSLYRYVAPLKNAIKPAGEWNVVEITARGPRIRVVLNGQLVQDVDQSKIDELRGKPLCGYISVQNHGHLVEFRNVWIRDLTALASAPAKRCGLLSRWIARLRSRVQCR